jgi:hypothetical protein
MSGFQPWSILYPRRGGWQRGCADKCPQRQTLPDIATAMSVSVGFGLTLSSAAADMIWPDWQLAALHDSRRARPAAARLRRLSIHLDGRDRLVGDAADRGDAGSTLPSMCTVQAPHSATPRDLVPVMPVRRGAPRQRGVVIDVGAVRGSVDFGSEAMLPRAGGCEREATEPTRHPSICENAFHA